MTSKGKHQGVNQQVSIEPLLCVKAMCWCLGLLRDKTDKVSMLVELGVEPGQMED